jgi:hypothetical protein
MQRALSVLATLTLAPSLAGCGAERVADPPQRPVEAQQPDTPVPAAPAAEAPFPADERDPAKVLDWWAAALERRDWAGARRIWGQFGTASELSAQGFARQWEPYRTLAVEVGKGESDGAAGSLYYEVSVSISGTRQDGQPYRLSGIVTLRRVNDVDGATPEQLRWHIERSTLRP